MDTLAITLVPPRDRGDRAWLTLRSGLFPDRPEPEHLEDMTASLARGHYLRLALAIATGTPAGYVEAAKRTDYVNGTSSSPVAFLEELYVAPEFRRRGVARALVESVVEWARREGCAELASDSLLDNAAAHAAHRALGFEETERVVYFRRTLGGV